MSESRESLGRRVRRWLAAIVSWLELRMGERRPRQLGGATPDWGARAATLDPELVRALDDIGDSPVVRDTVASAIAHFCDLRDVVSGPGAGDLIDDLDLVADAEAVLREIIGRAPDVSAVVAVARERDGDRAGREAAGDALLALRDRARALGEAASAALVWGASRDRADRRRLERCAARLRRP